MKIINIKSTEIILQNYEEGKGKIIVSDLIHGSYSYYWGAMGGTIEEFLLKINSEYFSRCLCSEIQVFSGKNTAKEIRRHIREDMKYELPWYEYMEGQKELRGLIKQVENADNKDEAIYAIGHFHKDIDGFEMTYSEIEKFVEILENTFASEPWHFLRTEPSPQYTFLKNLHKELIEELKK